MNTTRFQQTIDAIDAANRLDPNTETWQGEEHPKELLYGRRMSAWLEKLNPEAPEALRLAARAQHIRRWEIPRSGYPEGRAGYHQWRTFLYQYHGEKAAEILSGIGYGEGTVERVKLLIGKKKIKTDPDAQTLEDAACLVFLENHLANFIADYDYSEEKFVKIVQRTWAKMSDAGHNAALGLDLPDRAAALVHKALNP